MNRLRFLSIPIFAVFLLVSFVYYTTVFVFIEDWVGLQSSAGVLNASIFSIFGSLCLFSFCVCVNTDPGHVPSSYIPDVEDTGLLHQESNKNGVERRQCDKCSTYKPPRAHHCRVCKSCVLKMDHHCLWINNCVGHFNYKAFFILVLYGTIASIYSTVIVIICAIQKGWDSESGRLPLKVFYVTFGAMMCTLCLTLGSLLGWHIYLISCNMTTIEYYEGIRGAWLAKKSGQSYKHPFDHGVYKNFNLVLGSNILKWLWPTAINHLKDGIDFPTTRDSS